MITRFDHAVIAVANLARAIEAYHSLGFDVFPGGRHEHRGTHNALIRFGGADYIELLGVYDADRAVRSGPNGRALAEFVRDRRGGLVGHCYSSQDIEVDAARMRRAGLEVVGPFEMRRQRADGQVLTWRLLVPVDVPWRRRWPFFIQWDDPEEERLSLEGTGKHPNSATSVAGVAVAVGDLDEASELYSALFDSEPFRRDEVTSLAAARASFDVRGFIIDLLTPVGEGPVGEAVARDGEGPFEVKVEVADLKAASRALARAGVNSAEDTRQEELHLPIDVTLGARVVLTESS